MTTPLTADLGSQLQRAPLQQIADQLGVDRTQAQSAVGAALPLLLGALGRNASQPQGAQALFGALQKDHAGLDLGSVLGSVLGGGGQGGDILGHIFGGNQQRAETGVAQATGLDGGQAGRLLKILAPIVMAYLARRMFSQGQADAPAAAGNAGEAGPRALGDLLGQEHQHAQQGGGLLGAVLDQDGDGQLGIGDLLKAGGSILGGKP